jgi:tRNA modification GTPase
MFPLDDTIAAIASPPGGAIRGILRISGPDGAAVVARVGDYSRPIGSIHRPASVNGTLELPQGLGKTPVMLYLWPTAKSYTREPCAELHLPGSPPLLAAALEAVCTAGARLARPGEFTLRAFLAGRLDLTQAEAVLGVIDADSRQQLDSALGQLAGGLARPLANLREELLDLLAHLEAGLDFVDEDLEFISRSELARELTAAESAVVALAAQMVARGEAGELPRIVLYGMPNAGKSSLLNSLAGDDAALVSEVAGTTRDFVTRRIRLAGRDCLFTDTAGVLASSGTAGLERAAQDASSRERKRSDLILRCIDNSCPLTEWDQAALQPADERCLIVWTKCDLPPGHSQPPPRKAIPTSSRTGAGLTELRHAIVCALEESKPGSSGIIAGTAERCRDSLRLAGEALHRARAAAHGGLGEELVAAEIRVALEELGHVVGAVYTEDILDRIFSRFCIGK